MGERNRYVYGSAAPQLPQKPERKEPVRKQAAAPAVRPRSAYAHVPKGKLFFAIITMSAMCFVMLYRFSILADLNSKMGTMTQQLNSLKDENRVLRVAIETGVNLDNVGKTAEEQLGMHKPDRFQVVPVSVPKNDYSVVLDQQYIKDAESPKKSFFENAIDAISAAFP